MERLGRILAGGLVELALSRQDIWVIDGDLADSTGADVFADAVPSKFIQAGIAEQSMVSIAAGLATCKMRPWVFSFAAFLCYRAYDQIRVCLSHTRLPVTLVGSHAGALTGRNGKSHAALNDIALIATLPFFTIWAPGSAEDAKFLVDLASSCDGPSYIRLPRENHPELLGTPAIVRWIGRPTTVALAGCGLSTTWAIRASQLLADVGIEMGVLHFCKIWPIDRIFLEELLENVETLIVVEDHGPFGGLADILRNSNLGVRIAQKAWPIDWGGQSGLAKDLLARHSLQPRDIAEYARSMHAVPSC